jgi:hypothetical protein
MNEDYFPQDEEPIDDVLREMEREEQPRRNPTLELREITPVLTTKKQYRNVYDRYMTTEMGPTEIEPNIVYFDPRPLNPDQNKHKRKQATFPLPSQNKDEGQVKFLLLPKALQPYINLHEILKRADWDHCARAGNGQKRGKKITIGWLPQIPGRAKGSGYYNVRNKATLDQPQLLYGLRPLLREMEDKVREFLPLENARAWDVAISAERREGEEDDLSRVPERITGLEDEIPNPRGLVRNLEPWNMTYTLCGTSFSTLELNRNIIFKTHEDKRNVPGALICITTLGHYVGGRLVFPRYGYSAELEPGDLLICDNNRELHGNIGPLVAPRPSARFSIVAYFHTSVLEYKRREGHWKRKPASL